MRLLYRNNYIGIIYSVNSGIEINANSSNLHSKRLVVFIPEVENEDHYTTVIFVSPIKVLALVVYPMLIIGYIQF